MKGRCFVSLSKLLSCQRHYSYGTWCAFPLRFRTCRSTDSRERKIERRRASTDVVSSRDPEMREPSRGSYGIRS